MQRLIFWNLSKSYFLIFSETFHSFFVESLAELASYLRDFVGDIVRAVLDLWSDDGFLRWRRGGALLLIVGLGEVECDEGDLVDGAVLVEVRVRGGAEQAGFDLTERPWERHDDRGTMSLKIATSSLWLGYCWCELWTSENSLLFILWLLWHE